MHAFTSVNQDCYADTLFSVEFKFNEVFLTNWDYVHETSQKLLHSGLLGISLKRNHLLNQRNAYNISFAPISCNSMIVKEHVHSIKLCSNLENGQNGCGKK